MTRDFLIRHDLDLRPLLLGLLDKNNNSMAFKYYSLLLTVFNYYILLTSGQTVESDPGVHGPALELVHLYYDQFPTGKFIYPSQYQLFPYFLRFHSRTSI
jgi:hypothetical protein